MTSTRWTTIGMPLLAAVLLQPAPAAAMNAYKWKYRPLLVFADSPGSGGLVQQRQIVARLRPAFIDRQVVVIYVVGDTVRADLGPAPGMAAEALRKRYGVGGSETRIVLVGKDGGVKLEESKPIAAETLFRTIDSMPMRADEMKRR